MEKNQLKVIISGGGTGGHIFPAIAIANAVKEPFDIGRAKATAYQTGVWVPLIVAGPVVAEPNRDVEHMVNMVDVFRLFGDMAGIDVPAAVPREVL